jgi:hypothetical protein
LTEVSKVLTASTIMVTTYHNSGVIAFIIKIPELSIVVRLLEGGFSNAFPRDPASGPGFVAAP